MRMADIKNENYVNIQGFMVNELKLKGNELLTYAIIYGFSQKDGQWFEGTLSYIASWLGVANKNTPMKCVNSLCKKGFIEKKEIEVNNVKFCKYRALTLDEIKERIKNLDGCPKKIDGRTKNLDGGVQKSCTPLNNINNNINNIKDKINNNNSAAAQREREKDNNRAVSQLPTDSKEENMNRADKAIRDMDCNQEEKTSIRNAISYYLEEYKTKFGIDHPLIKLKSMHRIVSTLLEPIDDDSLDIWNILYDDGYIDMIDRHFRTNYGENTDYNLNHFATPGIILYQARNCGYMDGVSEE